MRTGEIVDNKMDAETEKAQAAFGATSDSEKCGWCFMDGSKCLQAATMRWIGRADSMPVCDAHAKQVRDMGKGFGPLVAISPNDPHKRRGTETLNNQKP